MSKTANIVFESDKDDPERVTRISLADRPSAFPDAETVSTVALSVQLVAWSHAEVLRHNAAGESVKPHNELLLTGVVAQDIYPADTAILVVDEEIPITSLSGPLLIYLKAIAEADVEPGEKATFIDGKLVIETVVAPAFLDHLVEVCEGGNLAQLEACIEIDCYPFTNDGPSLLVIDSPNVVIKEWRIETASGSIIPPDAEDAESQVEAQGVEEAPPSTREATSSTEESTSGQEGGGVEEGAEESPAVASNQYVNNEAHDTIPVVSEVEEDAERHPATSESAHEDEEAHDATPVASEVEEEATELTNVNEGQTTVAENSTGADGEGKRPKFGLSAKIGIGIAACFACAIAAGLGYFLLSGDGGVSDGSVATSLQSFFRGS